MNEIAIKRNEQKIKRIEANMQKLMDVITDFALDGITIEDMVKTHESAQQRVELHKQLADEAREEIA